MLVQEGIVNIRDSEEARVVYPKPYASPPRLTLKIDQAWKKDQPYSIEDFRISAQNAYAFKIENNHREKLSGAWAALKWKAEGTALADKPAASRSKPEQIIAMVEKLGGSVSADTRLPDRPITTVDLHACRATDRDLELLEGLDTLRTLNLYGTRVTDEGLGHLSALRGLRTLQLNSTAITDAGLRRLAGLTGLTELGLYGTRVTDEGLPSLMRLKNLQKLVLGGSQITDKGLHSMAGLKNLRQLILSGTNVTRSGVQELQRALPNLVIVR
jgi:hypothetical protein